MAIKLLIFDCDGVIVDSREANKAYYNTILKALGRKPLTEEELSYVHMHTAEESIKFLFREAPELLSKALDYQKTVDYSSFIKFLTLEPGLKTFISQVRPPLKTAISTNRTNTMDQLLKAFSLDSYFDLVITALKTPKPKPHPMALLTILEYFSLKPKEALYIGDSHIDQILAQRVGVPFVAYKNVRLQADYKISSFLELHSILGKYESRRTYSKVSSKDAYKPPFSREAS